jgi:hypothetical protein
LNFPIHDDYGALNHEVIAPNMAARELRVLHGLSIDDDAADDTTASRNSRPLA